MKNKEANKKRKWWIAIPLLLLILPLSAAVRLRWFSSSGVIVYGSDARRLFSQCSRSSPFNVSGYYLPSLGDASRVEKTLPQYLSQQRCQDKALNFSDYHFQYAGFTRQGRNMIYVNAFP